MKKRLVSLVLSLAMVASLFAGCGGSNNADANADANNDAVVSTEKEDATPAPAPATKITVAAFEGAYGADLWHEVAAAYTEVTGVEVNVIVDKELEAVIGPAMQGGDFPDVIHLATGRKAGLTEQFIKDNLITDITDVLSMTIPGESVKVADKLIDGFADTTSTKPYGDDKTYLAPMFYSPCGLFYNAGLFEEKGWAVPTTWDEMWALGETAKAEGIALFTYPTAGYFDGFFYALMYSVGGADFFNAATNYEEGIWDTAEGQKVLEIMGKVASYTHASTPAQASSDYLQNQQLVLDNKALFMPNGTWVVGEMIDATRAEGFKWGMTALPAVDANGAGCSYTYFEQAWIPSGAVNQDAAKQFVSFLYSDKACEIFAKHGAVQPVPGLSDKLEGDNITFYSIYDNGATAVMSAFAPFNAVEGSVNTVGDVFFTPMDSLVAGTMTVDQWIENIKAANDIMRENIIK